MHIVYPKISTLKYIMINMFVFFLCKYSNNTCCMIHQPKPHMRLLGKKKIV